MPEVYNEYRERNENISDEVLEYLAGGGTITRFEEAETYDVTVPMKNRKYYKVLLGVRLDESSGKFIIERKDED